MRPRRLFGFATLATAAVLTLAPMSARAQVNIQCPCDRNGDGDCKDVKTTGPAAGRYNEPALAATDRIECMHLGGGDGFATMADGRPQYIFGFSNLTGIGDVNGDGDVSDDVMTAGALAAEWPAPTIAVDEGEQLYLSLTNVGMLIRPDLFDPHTVHFHGFPQSSAVFDGLPESGVSINMGATLTYYYNLVEPGTYLYHCHVEATEHMQMGMLGNLYVRAGQNGTALGACAGGAPCTMFAYNDGDGSTGYDVEYALQLGSFDPEFHDASWTVQPLPFANMWDRYPMINGRGYPDTINPLSLPASPEGSGAPSQKVSSLIQASAGSKVLLRLSNLNITTVHTLSSPSLPMRVVGIDAKQLRGTTGQDLSYSTNSVTLGGGMTADVILDTAGVAPGEYYLHAANLQYLANFDEAETTGGMMTKIVVN